MHVERQGLEAISATARNAKARVATAYENHLAALASWDDPKQRKVFTAEHIATEKARIRAKYQAEVASIRADTQTARNNLQLAAAERSPASLLKAALTAAAPSDQQQAMLAELRAARLREDAKLAPAEDLQAIVTKACAKRDLHALAVVDREIRTRQWALTDRGRIAVRLAVDRALDEIDAFVPGRTAEVQLIEATAKAFHHADEYLRAAVSGREPLPVQMERTAKRD